MGSATAGPAPSGLGDLSVEEVEQIQAVVDRAGALWMWWARLRGGLDGALVSTFPSAKVREPEVT